MINLDHASHTTSDPQVLAAFCRIENTFHGNPMADHTLGRQALGEMSRITQKIHGLLGLDAHEVIFTSGASEANNLAIKGLVDSYGHQGKHILTTPLEHPSTSAALTALVPLGFTIELVKILPTGHICLKDLQAKIRRDTVLMAISHIDSELGVIQPLEEICQLLADHPHVKLHVDGAQSVGKIPVKIFDQVASFAFSPHKFYGICGVGGLVKRGDVVLTPMIHGGQSASIYRSGTPALSLMGASAVALALAITHQQPRFAYVSSLQKQVRENLANHPKITLNTAVENTSPYILNMSYDGVKGRDIQQLLDQQGIAISVKSACSTKNTPSRPVFAMGGNKKRAMESFRISFSHTTTMDEIEKFCNILCSM